MTIFLGRRRYSRGYWAGSRLQGQDSYNICRPRIQTSDTGGEELVAEQTVKDQVCLVHDFYSRHANIYEIYHEPNLDSHAGIRFQLEDFATEALVETYEDLLMQSSFPLKINVHISIGRRT